jgi:hypothetical protein
MSDLWKKFKIVANQKNAAAHYPLTMQYTFHVHKLFFFLTKIIINAVKKKHNIPDMVVLHSAFYGKKKLYHQELQKKKLINK